MVVAGLAACGSPDRPAGPANLPEPVSRAEAESLLATAVSLARQPNFCAVVAASEEQCRSEAAFAASVGWRPGDTPPRVTGVRQLPARVTGGSPVTVLELAGTRADATPFTADFATTRTDLARIRSLTPVYWSGVGYRDRFQEASTVDSG
ncbi:hypothetical protein ACGFMK_35725 [Amycolatopsis sp. NPDC049252]|uniref:hypothetical protein n=1 Tax=Amycolatopsis sp. NPDC049252 TaxID=3363933 RepID=UPI00371E2C45